MVTKSHMPCFVGHHVIADSADQEMFAEISELLQWNQGHAFDQHLGSQHHKIQADVWQAFRNQSFVPASAG